MTNPETEKAEPITFFGTDVKRTRELSPDSGSPEWWSATNPDNALSLGIAWGAQSRDNAEATQARVMHWHTRFSATILMSGSIVVRDIDNVTEAIRECVRLAEAATREYRDRLCEAIGDKADG